MTWTKMLIFIYFSPPKDQNLAWWPLFFIAYFASALVKYQIKLITISIQRMQTPPRLWHLTLWCDLAHSSRSKKLMSLDVAYCTEPWYQVWCLWVYYFTWYHHLFTLFDLHLWPSAFVKVTCTLIIICISCCWIFVIKRKFVGSVEFEIWTFVYRKLNWR